MLYAQHSFVLILGTLPVLRSALSMQILVVGSGRRGREVVCHIRILILVACVKCIELRCCKILKKK